MPSVRMFGVLCSSLVLPAVSGIDFQITLPYRSSWRFAFASCHDYPGSRYTRSPAEGGNAANVGATFNWSLIEDRGVSALVWGGDIIYGDIDSKNITWLPRPWSLVLPEVPLHTTTFQAASGDKLRYMYGALRRDRSFATLLDSLGGAGSPRHLGTWDDHDYGLNDGDKMLATKDGNKDAFLAFFDAPPNDPRRGRSGVYASTLFTSPSHEEETGGGSSFSVLVLALDMRFNKDPYGDSSGDFLGEEQWEWLEATLRASTARAHVFVSSLQLLVEGREALGECWGKFPRARERFLRLLSTLEVKAPLIVSGDVHFAEVNAATCGSGGGSSTGLNVGGGNGVHGRRGDEGTPVGTPLVELTTSGLTHSWRDGMGHIRKESQRYMYLGMLAFQYLYPWTYQTRSNGGAARDFYLGTNFGELEFKGIDESGGKGHVHKEGRSDGELREGKQLLPSVVVRVLDGRTGNPVIEKEWPLRTLDMVARRGGGGGVGLEDASEGEVFHCGPHRGPASRLRRAVAWAALTALAIAFLAWKPLLWYVFICGLRNAYRARRRTVEQEKED